MIVSLDSLKDPKASSIITLADNRITDENNITGTFQPKPYELILNSGTGGSVVGSGNYPFGSSVTISAYPQPGYSFSHWIGSGTLNPLDPSTDVVMLQQRSLFAIFTLNEISKVDSHIH